MAPRKDQMRIIRQDAGFSAKLGFGGMAVPPAEVDRPSAMPLAPVSSQSDAKPEQPGTRAPTPQVIPQGGVGGHDAEADERRKKIAQDVKKDGGTDNKSLQAFIKQSGLEKDFFDKDGNQIMGLNLVANNSKNADPNNQKLKDAGHWVLDINDASAGELVSRAPCAAGCRPSPVGTRPPRCASPPARA